MPPSKTYLWGRIKSLPMSFLPFSILLGVIGPGQIAIIIGVIVLLFFGGKKIPELMKGLGQGMREFKKAKDGTDEDKKEEGK